MFSSFTHFVVSNNEIANTLRMPMHTLPRAEEGTLSNKHSAGGVHETLAWWPQDLEVRVHTLSNSCWFECHTRFLLHVYNQSSLVLKVQISPKCLRTGLLRLFKFPFSIYLQHAFYPRRNFRLEHNHWYYRHISRRFGWREFKYVYFARWLCYTQRCFLKNPLFLLSLPGLKLVPRWDLPCLISITVSQQSRTSSQVFSKKENFLEFNSI